MGEFFDEEGELNWSWSIDELKLVYFDHPCIQDMRKEISNFNLSKEENKERNRFERIKFE